MSKLGQPFLSGRIPQKLWDAVNKYASKHNKTRTEVMIAAMRAYLDVPEPKSPTDLKIEQLEEKLEERINQLEQAIKELQGQAQEKSPPPLKDFFSSAYDKHYRNK